MHTTLRLLSLVIILSITACETAPEAVAQQVLVPVPAQPQPSPPIQAVVQGPTAVPILNAKKSDIIFAQSSLKALGYQIDKIDGTWGKRSESAIRLFEKNQNIQSANGELSSLNLYTLQNTHEPLNSNKKNSGQTVNPSIQSELTNNKSKSNFSGKLSSSIPNRKAPELVIVDQVYSILVKPNPYSATIINIEAGTGVYVLSQQNGWYEVETLNNQRGFIRDRAIGN